MAKIKASNLGHSNALRHSGKVKKETPDMKSRRVSEQGVKGKLDKKKLGSVGKKKKKSTKGKSGFSSDSRVKCDWCDESFCRWVYLLSRSWVLCHPCFRFREMVPHVFKEHKFHVRINCKVRSKTGFCSWSCGSKLHCYTRHLKLFHGRKKSGLGEFPKDSLFLTATRDHLKKGVSYTLISRFQ